MRIGELNLSADSARLKEFTLRCARQYGRYLVRLDAQTAHERASDLLLIGEPADIARAVLCLARDARYVTGHVIPEDGGRGLTI